MTEHQPPHQPGQHGPTNANGPGGPGSGGPKPQGPQAPSGPGQYGPGFSAPGQGGSGRSGPYPPNPPYDAQPPYPQSAYPHGAVPPQNTPPQNMPPQNMPPQGMPPQGMGPQGYGYGPGQPPPPGQGWGAPPPGFGGPPPPRKGPGGWVWALFAVAIAMVLGTIVYAMATLFDTSEGGTAPSTPPPVTVPATPAATPSSAPPSETEPPEPVLPPAVPHASEGLFLSPAYAGGGRTVAVTAESYLEMVGASADGGIVAVNSDYQLRGISVATSKVLWTYPTYSCSQGSWDGVVLCADTDDPQTASNGGPVPDIVGIDLATGKALFRFAPEHMPGHMDFIGADDAHGYFRVSLLGMEGYEALGKHHVLALNKDGSIAWMTPIEIDGFMGHAALVSGDKISVSVEKTMIVMDRATGTISTNLEVGDSLIKLLWDGWNIRVGGDDKKPEKVFDLDGNLVSEYRFVDDFIPDPFPSGGVLSVPAYESGGLNGGEDGYEPIWAVTRNGERVVGNSGYDIVSVGYRYTVKSAQVHGLSADGALFVSDLNSGTVHDSQDGTALASFPPPDDNTDLVVVDGILFQNHYTIGEDKIVVLLPGA